VPLLKFASLKTTSCRNHRLSTNARNGSGHVRGIERRQRGRRAR